MLWYLSKLKKKTFHLSRLSNFCNNCNGKWVWVRDTSHLTCQVTVNKILAESWAQTFTFYSVVPKFINGTCVLKWIICKSIARSWIQNCKDFCRIYHNSDNTQLDVFNMQTILQVEYEDLKTGLKSKYVILDDEKRSSLPSFKTVLNFETELVSRDQFWLNHFAHNVFSYRVTMSN